MIQERVALDIIANLGFKSQQHSAKVLSIHATSAKGEAVEGTRLARGEQPKLEMMKRILFFRHVFTS